MQTARIVKFVRKTSPSLVCKREQHILGQHNSTALSDFTIFQEEKGELHFGKMEVTQEKNLNTYEV